VVGSVGGVGAGDGCVVEVAGGVFGALDAALVVVAEVPVAAGWYPASAVGAPAVGVACFDLAACRLLGSLVFGGVVFALPCLDRGRVLVCGVPAVGHQAASSG